MKKRTLKALDKSEKSGHDVDLFVMLCDFNVLSALSTFRRQEVLVTAPSRRHEVPCLQTGGTSNSTLPPTG